MRIPYGLDRLPRDWGARCVEVGDEPLRLNSAPVPADVMPLVAGDHAARVAAAAAWLESQCGDYAPLRRQLIAGYLRWAAAQIEAHREALAERLKPYEGLYAPEDFLWSALRPLPRGWVPVDGSYLPADVVFWDGTRSIAIELGSRETERQNALIAAGAAVCRMEPGTLALPEGFHRFWLGQVLPSSPFRRPTPSRPPRAERELQRHLQYV